MSRQKSQWKIILVSILVSFTLLLVQCTHGSLVDGENLEEIVDLSLPVINRCPEVYSYKNQYEKVETVLIPASHSSIDEDITFRFNLKFQPCLSGLEPQLVTLSLQETEISSTEDNELTITTVSNLELPEDYYNYRKGPKPSQLQGKVPNQFMPNGILRFNTEYYDTNEYCVLNSNATHIVLHICPVNCDLTPCINKCCNLHEVIQYQNETVATCQYSNEEIRWSPFFYEGPHTPVSDNKKIKPRYKRVSLSCPWYQKLPARDLTRLHPTWEKILWRVLKNGQVIYLNEERSWVRLPKTEYCIDGLQNIYNEGDYKGLSSDQIIFMCPPTTSESDSQITYSQFYAVICYIASAFYLAIAIVYIVIIKQQNIQCLTILSYIMSMLLYHVLIGTAHYLSYLEEHRSNMEEPIMELGSTSSAIFAIVTHFFVLASFTWISIMSFDLLCTFRSTRPISQESQLCRFLAYSGFGWGLPFFIVAACATLDFIFADPESEIIVPEYGKWNYFITPGAQGIYLYYLCLLIFSINLIFIIMSIISLWKFHQSTNNMLSQKNNTEVSSTLTFKLFAKLFITMGVLTIFELISWLHTGTQNTWYWILMDVIKSLQAVALFVIFVCNQRILRRLKTKFSFCKAVARSPTGTMKSFSTTTTRTRRLSSSHATNNITPLSLSMHNKV